MKRDLDLIRIILLEVEDKYPGSGQMSITYDHFDGYDSKVVAGHFDLLANSSYLLPGVNLCPKNVWLSGLSNDGHDFLDSVRDPIIWKKTQDATEAVGSWTLSVASDLAKGFLKTKIQKHTGVEF